RDLVDQLEIVDGMLDGLSRLALRNEAGPLVISAAPPAVVASINRHADAAGEATTQKRVRGVLAAVREIVQELQGPFDKNDVMAKLSERDPKLAAKVSTANLRNAL